MKRPRRSSSETRSEILAKAEDLFRSGGYAGTSIADIAAALAMSPANVFKHFPSKMALAEVIAASHLEEIARALDAIPAALAPPLRLRRFAETLLAAHIRNMRGNPHVFDIVVLMMRTQPAHVVAFDAHLRRTVLAILAAGNESGDFRARDPALVAGVVLDCLAATTHPLMIEHVDEAELARRQARTLDFVIAALHNDLEK